MNPPCVVLRHGRERSLGLGHPWLLSGSVDRVEGNPGARRRGAGARRRGHAARDRRLGPRCADPRSLFAFGKDEVDEAAWLESALERALAWRRGHPLLLGTDALRLVHTEADGLPGLTVDRYADWLERARGHARDAAPRAAHRGDPDAS